MFANLSCNPITEKNLRYIFHITYRKQIEIIVLKLSFIVFLYIHKLLEIILKTYAQRCVVLQQDE